MREIYEINRNKDFHQPYVDFADEYLIKAFRVYDKFYFFRKKKKLRLIKEHAINQLMDIEDNLIHRNWVCLSKSEKKLNVVRGFIRGSMGTIDSLTEIKWK